MQRPLYWKGKIVLKALLKQIPENGYTKDGRENGKERKVSSIDKEIDPRMKTVVETPS